MTEDKKKLILSLVSILLPVSYLLIPLVYYDLFIPNGLYIFLQLLPVLGIILGFMGYKSKYRNLAIFVIILSIIDIIFILVGLYIIFEINTRGGWHL